MADKLNRLDSQFQVVAAFWPPDSAETVYNGTLKIDHEGISFTTAPLFEKLKSGNVLWHQDGAAKFSALHGFSEHGLCTLCRVVEGDRPGSINYAVGLSISSINYAASVCLTGLHIGGLADKCLTSAKFSFSGLGEWLPKSTTEVWEEDHIAIRVPREAQRLLWFSVIESHAQISLNLFSEFTHSAADGARLSRSVAYVEVLPENPEDLAWYFQVGNRLENLFSLLTGKSLALETIFIYRGDENGHVTALRKTPEEAFHPLSCVRCTPSQLATSLAVWLAESDGFRSVENLVLGVVRKGKLFAETEFLSLAQALEGIHRATSTAIVADRTAFRQTRKKIVAILKGGDVPPTLARRICDSMSHVNEPTFASRIHELCARISPVLLQRMEIDPGRFTDIVVRTRNFYTHAGGRTRPTAKNRPLSGSNLFLLNQKMRALLRGILLLHLQIPEEQLSELLVREATRWRAE